jgi:Tfp pilus assembly protein PilN
MKLATLALLATGMVVAQSSSVNDAYQRGVQLGNQQSAIVVDCLSHPGCIAALQAAQARKDEAKAEKTRLKAEAQSRKDAAKAERERQKTEVKLAKLRQQTEREAAKREAFASANHASSSR